MANHNLNCTLQEISLRAQSTARTAMEVADCMQRAMRVWTHISHPQPSVERGALSVDTLTVFLELQREINARLQITDGLLRFAQSPQAIPRGPENAQTGRVVSLASHTGTKSVAQQLTHIIDQIREHCDSIESINQFLQSELRSAREQSGDPSD